MSRWIDAEWLKELYEPYKSFNGKMYSVPVGAILANIDDAPSIDIVRCAECRYWNTSGCRDGVGECEWAYYMTKPDDFCSYGEREGE